MHFAMDITLFEEIFIRISITIVINAIAYFRYRPSFADTLIEEYSIFAKFNTGMASSSV